MPLHIPFNTLQYANKLKKAGIEHHAAEAHAEAQAEVWSSLLKNQIATKHDVFKLEKEIQHIDSKVEHLGETLRLEMQLLSKSLTIRLGSLIMLAVGSLATLMTIFRWC